MIGRQVSHYEVIAPDADDAMNMALHSRSFLLWFGIDVEHGVSLRAPQASQGLPGRDGG